MGSPRLASLLPAKLLPARIRFRRALTDLHSGRIHGQFVAVPTDAPPRQSREPLNIHFWTPNPWPSKVVHVERVIPELRRQAAALGLPWQINSGALPNDPVDWLLCLKAIPPAGLCDRRRTVLLQPDDADRVWARLHCFGHVVSVSSPVFAALLGTAHPRAWFVEETEPDDVIEAGGAALDAAPPSQRPPLLLWHGSRESLDGLYAMRDSLTAFGGEVDTELVILTDLPERIEQWGRLRVRFVALSPQVLAAFAARARLGLVPARPTLADSYPKSAGRMRALFARGCPAIGDARSPDVVAFSEACGMPSAHSGPQWLSALREVWHQADRLDRIAGEGHTLIRSRFGASRTASQWLWFLAGGAEARARQDAALAEAACRPPRSEPPSVNAAT